MALTITLPLADIAAGKYGIGKKINVTQADLNALGAFTTGTFVIPDVLPPGAIVRFVRVIPTIAVVGATAPVVTSVASSPASNTYTLNTDLTDITTFTTLQPTSSNVESVTLNTTLTINMNTGGNNWSTITAGAFSLIIRYELIA